MKTLKGSKESSDSEDDSKQAKEKAVEQGLSKLKELNSNASKIKEAIQGEGEQESSLTQVGPYGSKGGISL